MLLRSGSGSARDRARGGVGGEVCCGSIGLASMGSGSRGGGEGAWWSDRANGDSMGMESYSESDGKQGGKCTGMRLEGRLGSRGRTSIGSGELVCRADTGVGYGGELGNTGSGGDGRTDGGAEAGRIGNG